MFDKGQEAVEFILITILVFFAALFTVLVFGNKISKFFVTDSSAAKISQGSVNLIDPGQMTRYNPDYETKIKEPTMDDAVSTDPAEEIDSTIDDTDTIVVNGDSTIDLKLLNDLELKGIPQDYNSYIESSGSSGGTKVVADVLKQIAMQLEEQGKTEDSNEIKKLASLSHNMAAIENTIEQAVNDCDGSESCVKALQSKPLPKPADFDETYTSFPAKLSYHDATFSLALGSNYHPAQDELINQYKSVMADNSIDNSVKDVVQELYWDIGVIGQDFQNNVFYYYNGIDQNYYDPLTNEHISEPKPKDLYDNFKSYKASKISHFDSALICASGKGNDTGKRCH